MSARVAATYFNKTYGINEQIKYHCYRMSFLLKKFSLFTFKKILNPPFSHLKNSKFFFESQPLYIIHKEYPVKTGKSIVNLLTSTEKEIFSRLYV